jgi:hypothetical protein
MVRDLSWIQYPDPGSGSLSIPDQGSKSTGSSDPGSRSATLIARVKKKIQYLVIIRNYFKSQICNPVIIYEFPRCFGYSFAKNPIFLLIRKCLF